MDICDYIETLRARLAESTLTREQISAASGNALSVSWISKFAAGRMRNPRVESLLSLERALGEQTERAA